MFISALRKKGLLLISTCGTFFFIEWAKKFLPAAGTAQLAIKHLIVVHQRKGRRMDAFIIFVIPITSRIDPQHSLSRRRRHPED